MADNNVNDVNQKSGLVNQDTTESLKDSIDKLTKSVSDLSKKIDGFDPNVSQANAKTFQDDYKSRGYGDTRRSRDTIPFSDIGKFRKKDFGRTRKGFIDSLEEGLYEGLLGSNFKGDISNIFKKFAEQVGTDVEGIPDKIGKELGKEMIKKFVKKTKTGKQLEENSKKFTNRVTDIFNTRLTNIAKIINGEGIGAAVTPEVQQAQQQVAQQQSVQPNVNQSLANQQAANAQQAESASNNEAAEGADAVKTGNNNSEAKTRIRDKVKSKIDDFFSNRLKGKGSNDVEGVEAATEATEGAGAGEAMKEGASGVTSIFGQLKEMGGELLGASDELVGGFKEGGLTMIATWAAMKLFDAALDYLVDSVAMVGEGFKTITEGLKKAANREWTSREKANELAKQRMKDDYETMVKYPFTLLERAATDLYNSWNNNLTTVAATQGYDKAAVQDLMAAFAERIRNEGLSKEVSGAAMFDNLAKVISDGLSGAIAEEFAYQATILNKVVPTQDFFTYAKTYSSIAANAMRSGKSQEEAIAEANLSLQSFANNLVYASRELTGGFSTSLKEGSALYQESAEIALAARSDNLQAISSTLVALQGYVGAIAPDIASDMTQALYKALTGGNSSDIVALRSLAGVNASNTEFLQAFAANPQEIVATMFENLSNMYNQSSDAYMEKAEGYAQLFGLSAKAFQRVDFSGLADAVRSMNSTSDALNENMTLLKEGETVTTAEQLKAQQINQYMIEEGLSYVIDNEAAQMIQQHMWDEQMNQQLQEATYSVEIKGAVAEGVEKIVHGLSNTLNLLNPFSWLKKLGNIVSTNEEAEAQDADVRQLLELGKVGQGHQKSLMQLTTRGVDLQVTEPLINQMGGQSAYQVSAEFTKSNRIAGSLAQTAINRANQSIDTYNKMAELMSGGGIAGATSRYTWGEISKTQGAAAKALLELTSKQQATAPELATVATDAGQAAASASAAAAKEAIGKMLEDSYLVDEFVKQGKSYEDWASTASKFGIADLSSAIKSAGYTEEKIQQYFEDKETEEGAEEQHNIRVEEKVFRDTGVKFWTEDFPNDYRDPLFEDVDTMIENMTIMITNQETMITNQETMIDKLTSIIQHQEDWQAYFDETWKAWSNQDGLFNTYTRQAVITDGWDAFFKKGWVELSKNGWNSYFGGTESASFDKFYSEFMKYFVNHVYYDATEGYKYEDIKKAVNEENKAEKGDLVNSLAEALVSNIMDLKDPTVQTNALLAQILVMVSAIKNQTDDVNLGTEGGTLPTTMSGLALGNTTSSTTTTTT